MYELRDESGKTAGRVQQKATVTVSESWWWNTNI